MSPDPHKIISSEIAIEPQPDPPPNRPDVERVCDYLADRVAANGSKRPTVSRKWRQAARLMLDRDGRTEEQILRAIDWCQDHDFWRSNVMSMPKLREQYDRLRLAAQRGRPPAPGTDLAVINGTHSTAENRAAAGIQIANRLRQQREEVDRDP